MLAHMLFAHTLTVPSEHTTSVNGLLLFQELSFSIAFHSATVPSNVTDVKPPQYMKAKLPMLVTPFPMVTDVKPVHQQNTWFPILVTLSGMVMVVKPVQPRKASNAMLVTLPSLGITLVLQPAISVLLAVSIRQFPAL